MARGSAHALISADGLPDWRNDHEDLDDTPHLYDWEAHRKRVADQREEAASRLKRRAGARIGYDWSEAEIATLRRLWAEGVFTADIGKTLGRSKGAVVGKAHRLELPERDTHEFNRRARRARREAGHKEGFERKRKRPPA